MPEGTKRPGLRSRRIHGCSAALARTISREASCDSPSATNTSYWSLGNSLARMLSRQRPIYFSSSRIGITMDTARSSHTACSCIVDHISAPRFLECDIAGRDARRTISSGSGARLCAVRHPVLQYLRRHAPNHGIRRYVGGDHGACGQYGSIPDGDPRHEDAASPDPYIVADAYGRTLQRLPTHGNARFHAVIAGVDQDLRSHHHVVPDYYLSGRADNRVLAQHRIIAH